MTDARAATDVAEGQFPPDRVRGCLLGGAVGDSLGAPVEFMKWSAIAQLHGPDGVQEPGEAYGREGAITDDTQMTLFTAEGVLRGITRNEAKGIGGPMSTLPYAYLRWLHTQDRRLPAHIDERTRELILGGKATPPGWLIGVQGLHARRAPGNTCLASLRAKELGSRHRPLNDSKGCGTVMRVAPVALVRGIGIEEAFEVACESSALTHGHPTAWLAAGALVWILVRLRDGMELERAALDALYRVRVESGSQETVLALRAAVDLWNKREPARPPIVERLGAGWVAEEALAIAVYSALANQRDFAAGVRLAVNHSGDSDSTGSIAGQLLGAMLGEDAIPPRWLERLELREVIAAVADDLAVTWREGEAWWNRYPGY